MNKPHNWRQLMEGLDQNPPAWRFADPAGHVQGPRFFRHFTYEDNPDFVKDEIVQEMNNSIIADETNEMSS